TATGTAANILNISFRGGTPPDTEVVVNAVIFAYRDSLGKGVERVTRGDLDQIEAAIREVDKETRSLDQEILNRDRKGPPEALGTPVVGGGLGVDVPDQSPPASPHN